MSYFVEFWLILRRRSVPYFLRSVGLGRRKIQLVTTPHRPVNVFVMQSKVITAAKTESLAVAGTFRREDDDDQLPRLKPDATNLPSRLASRSWYGILRVDEPVLERSTLSMRLMALLFLHRQWTHLSIRMHLFSWTLVLVRCCCISIYSAFANSCPLQTDTFLFPLIHNHNVILSSNKF